MILYKTKNNETVRVDGGSGNGQGCTDCLPKTNTIPFTPTEDYNPATKKYVDDFMGDISKILDIINREHGDDENRDTDKPGGSLETGTNSDDWIYLINDDNKTITLYSYIGESDTVIVYKEYKVDDVIYSTKIASYDDNRFSEEKKEYMFKNKTHLKHITFNRGIDTTEARSMKNMFANYSGDDYTLETLEISNLDTSYVETFDYMFHGIRLKSNILDCSNFDTSNATSMSGMFEYCKCNDIIVKNFNTDKISDFSLMFGDCPNLEKLDLTSFSNASVTNYDSYIKCVGMFVCTTSLKEVKVNKNTWTITPGDCPSMFSGSKISSFTYV